MMMDSQRGRGGVGRVSLGRLLGFLLITSAGLLVYFKIWSFHSVLTEAKNNAAQLQRSYVQALNEAADWRRHCDTKAQEYDIKLSEMNKDLQERSDKIITLESEKAALGMDKVKMEREILQLKDKLKKNGGVKLKAQI